MSKTLFVGSLPYDTKEDALEAFFKPFEVESVTVITDRVTRRGKGYGFVEMKTALAAKEAMEQKNGLTLGKRTIFISEAKAKNTPTTASPQNDSVNVSSY